MRYKSFRIQNFKGIKDTTIDLSSSSHVGVFAFVGLNEGGKTTLLEAIHSFSPDSSTSELVGGDRDSGVPFRARVPRHRLSNFTGNVAVAATILLDAEDKATIIRRASNELDLAIDPSSLPDEILFDRQQYFEQGDFKKNYFTLRTPVRVKKGRERKWREPKLDEEVTKIRNLVYSLTPDIVYFPTFVFDFPEKIFLTSERGSRVNSFYKDLFQHILDFDGQGHTIDASITRRIRSDKLTTTWLNFWGLWNGRDDKDKIQHLMDRAGATVSKVVFGRWNQIFRDDAKGKEVAIAYEILEGATRDAKGNAVTAEEHDLAIKFQIRDGTRRFDVNDRSLGFRWFFAFMLFTQFRAARSNERPVVFLFDEPASNLHAAAQQKLIDSFPEIGKGKNVMIYTTHSHYMIEPKWLEQTFIVTNRADTPQKTMLDTVSLDDESLDIKVAKYRTFVNENPSLTTYFQPIIDRLEVVPSRFDINRPSVVLEGRSDYYVLRYASKLTGKNEFSMLPSMGAGTFGALASLHIGWGLGMLFVLDGDKKGMEERERYVSDFNLNPSDIITLRDLDPKLTVIEDLLDNDARQRIREHLELSGAPTKNQLRRFFQENLAAGNFIDLGAGFYTSASALLDKLSANLASRHAKGCAN